MEVFPILGVKYYEDSGSRTCTRLMYHYKVHIVSATRSLICPMVKVSPHFLSPIYLVMQRFQKYKWRHVGDRQQITL